MEHFSKSYTFTKHFCLLAQESYFHSSNLKLWLIYAKGEAFSQYVNFTVNSLACCGALSLNSLRRTRRLDHLKLVI